MHNRFLALDKANIAESKVILALCESTIDLKEGLITTSGNVVVMLNSKLNAPFPLKVDLTFLKKI